jgi:thiamine monophosphate kinase
LLGRHGHGRLALERLPLPRGFARACSELGLDPGVAALAGGDDYELLFTVRPDGPSAAALTRRLGVRVSELGRVERGSRHGPARGFEHFARG